MKLSLNIILDDLSAYNTLCYVQDRGRTFKCAGLIRKDPGEYNKDTLVVCLLSQILENKLPDDICAAAVIDTNIPQNAASLKNTVLFDTDSDITDLFSEIQQIFEKYSEWCTGMDQLLIRNRSIQDILTLSEAVIGNYITISDSAFSLVAYTQGLECSDEITNRLVKNGYHDQEAIDIFSQNNLMDFWRSSDDIYERSSGIITNYPMLGKVIHYNNTYYSHVVMLCNNKPITPGLKDLFAMLIDRLMVCFERQWVDNNQMPHVYDSLLLELLGPNELTEDAVSARARNAGLPATGNFRLIKVSTDDNSGVMLQRLCQELSARLPQSRVTLSKDILIALLILKDSDIRAQSVMKTLDGIMHRYGSRCGISDPFQKLSDIRLAGTQSKIALDFTRSSRSHKYHVGPPLQYERTMNFGGCYPLCIVSENEKDMELAKSSVAYSVLKKLDEYDKSHNTNNLELLYTYLINERRASDTAKLMHMHRNNVIYRIGKITDMINMDLNDCGVRFKLMFAFETFDPKE